MITTNYDLTASFVTKDFLLYVENETINIHLMPLKSFYNDKDWLTFYNIVTTPIKKLRDQLKIQKELDLYDIIMLFLVDLGKYKQYNKLYHSIIYGFNQIVDGFEVDLSTHKMYANHVEITREVLEYLLYVIKKSNGERIEKPRQFASEAERAFYLAQKEYEEQIRNMRQKQQNDGQDAMLKIFLSITYAFPSFTFEYLFEQTLAQIRWLQKYAAEAISYEVNKEIFAAGNMKRGSKLNFFIK